MYIFYTVWEAKREAKQAGRKLKKFKRELKNKKAKGLKNLYILIIYNNYIYIVASGLKPL
nr:MAG TPA: hypothetical protein [Caudoviricetes sp.]